MSKPSRWSIRSLADPSGVNFMLGLFAGPFFFEAVGNMRRNAWPEAAVPLMALAAFVLAAAAYNAVFKVVTAADAKREA